MRTAGGSASRAEKPGFDGAHENGVLTAPADA